MSVDASPVIDGPFQRDFGGPLKELAPLLSGGLVLTESSIAFVLFGSARGVSNVVAWEENCIFS